MKSGQWMYNFGDEEHWNECEYFNTREEAIEVGRAEAIEREEESYQIGQITCFIPSIDVDNVLDNISENAYDQCGEYADGYPNCTKEEKQKLQDMLDEVLVKWMDETNNHPTFYMIENTEDILEDLVIDSDKI
jgi:hypothetical protein